jgi:hypothetical protein
VGLVGLAYAIEEVAKETPSFLAAGAAAVIGALALAIFVRRQRRSTAPMFDLTLFENREFALGVVVALVSSFSVVGLELVLSQRLQLVLGYSPLQAALFVLPGSLLAFIGGPLAGWSAPRYGTAQVMAAALLWAAWRWRACSLPPTPTPCRSSSACRSSGWDWARRSRWPRPPSKRQKPLMSLRFWRSRGVPPPASPPAMIHRSPAFSSTH